MMAVNFNRTIQFIGFWLLLTGCTTMPSEAQTVYITKSGSKYHAGGCRYLSKSKIPVALKTAQEQGYGPCSVCAPETDVVEEEIQQSPDTAATPAPVMRTKAKPAPAEKALRSPSSSQCSAFTKAGARCKRAAGAGGKCWQHQ